MISKELKETLNSKSASIIRKMFEEGIVMKKKFGEDKVYDFSLGNPDLEPPKEVVEAIKAVANDTSPGIHGYMPNAGYVETRKAMAKKVSLEQSVDVNWENVIITVGAASALNCIFKSILSSDDEVIVPKPFFAEYRNYVKNFSGKLIEVPTKPDFSLDFDAIKSVLSVKTAAVLINSPNNPTGKVYSSEDIENLVNLLNKHKEESGRTPYLICDEPYRAITYDNKQVCSIFKYYDSSIIVSSFAKNLSIPGERIGYIAINDACEDREMLVSACVFSLRTLGCVNAPAFFQRVVEKSWDAKVDYSSYTKKRDMLMNILDKANIEYFRPEGAFYLFCKVPDKFNNDDMAFAEHLKKFNIICAPGVGFGGPGWFRLAYCVSEATIINSENAFINAMK